MLDNLVNPNLAGLTGHINYSYDSMSQAIPGIVMGVVGLIGIIFFLCILSSAMNGTRTNQYRKKLVDMYVSGMIRKFAKEDQIDLEQEYETFVKESKKAKLSEKSLDNVVEAELSEKIINESEKKVAKK